jgi:NADH-ubiquinone oxidoreductase chain 5
MNRVGDVAILLGLAWIINYGRWNFIYYFELIRFDKSLICWFVLLAAFTKRAQIPFSS